MRLFPTRPYLRQLAGAAAGALIALFLYEAFGMASSQLRALAFPPTEEGARKENIENVVTRARALLQEARP